MDKVKDYIINFIERDYSLPEDTDIMNFNYTESGYVDSISMIHFIVSLEDEFGITFTNEELNDPAIKTIGGLLNVVVEKMAGNEN